jgi:hypothetical protein
VSGLHRPSCYLSPALKRQSSQTRFFARRRARLISRPARGTANPLSWLDSAARRKPGSARRGARPTGRVKNAPTRLSLQTVDDQRRELTDACDRRGWQVVAKFCDEGVSGAKGRNERRFRPLYKAIVRHQFDIVAAWSVDRLGRGLQDLVGVLG